MQEQNNTHIDGDNGSKNIESKTRRTTAKKLFAIIAIVVVSLLLLFGGCVMLLHHSKVQTYLVGIVTDKLSKTLQADVEIKHFHYRPLNHLSVDSLYISDQQSDTLAL